MGVLLALAMPLVVTPATIGPFVLGKALYVRGIIEVLTAGWLVLLLLDRSYRPPRSRVLLALTLYALVSLAAGLAGVAPSRSFWSDHQRMAGTFDALHWLALAVVMASVLRTRRHWVTLVGGYVAIVFVLASIALAQAYLGVASRFLAGGPRVGATTGNPTFLSAMLMMVAILLAGGTAQYLAQGRAAWSLRQRIATAAAGALGVLVLGRALLLTGSRGPLVGLVCGVAVAAVGSLRLNAPSDRRYAVAWSAGLLALTAALSAWDFTVGRTAAEARVATTAVRAFDPSVAPRGLPVRLELWKTGLRGFRERPALGWGTESYARVFDRYAAPELQALTVMNAGSAHSQPVEELATKGALGGLAFALLWGTLAFVLVARVPPGFGFQSLTVLSALAALFVHHLAFFETPGTMLGFSILVAWTAAHERPLAVTQPPAAPARAAPWVTTAAAVLAIVALVLCVGGVHIPTYRAASHARAALNPALPVAERIRLADASFQDFPPMAPYLRRLVFLKIAEDLPRLPPPEQDRLVAFARSRGIESLNTDPGDARLLMAVLPLMQATRESADQLDQLEPYVTRLRELAPGRLQTNLIVATQALERGRFEEALSVVDAFQARVPRRVPALDWIRAQALAARSAR